MSAAPSVEWERRFKAQILKVLTVEGSQWTAEQATAAAESEFDAIDPLALSDFETENPEACADESMSYWDGDDE